MSKSQFYTICNGIIALMNMMIISIRDMPLDYNLNHLLAIIAGLGFFVGIFLEISKGDEL